MTDDLTRKNADSIREAEDERIIAELHRRALQSYRAGFDKIAESGFDHHRKLDSQNFQESDLIVTDRIVAYPESYEVSEPVFVGEMPLRADIPVMPKTCPRCGAAVQSTYLTPPDVGIAVGCTRCSWPTEEKPEPDSHGLNSYKAAAWELAAQILEEHTPRTDRGGVTPDVPMSEVVAHVRDHVVPSLRQRARIIERNHKVKP